MIAAALLILAAIYLACGFLFAIPFIWFGVKQMDPHAEHGSWGFRLMIFPGTLAFWPLLLRRWMKGLSQLPDEGSARPHAVKSINS